MTLADTPEREALRSSVARACAAADPWSALLDLGAPGIAVPEELGGTGGDRWDLAVLVSEVAAHLAPVPLLARVLAARALAAAEHPVPEAELALVADDLSWVGGSLTGRAAHVLGASAADRLVVLTGGALLSVDASDTVIEPLNALDPDLDLAHVHFDAAPAELIAGPGAWDRVALERDRVVVLAASAVGGSAAALAAAVRYAGERIQFGRPIGSFQAVRHRLVDLTLELDRAETALEATLRAVDAGEPDVALLVPVAAFTCAEVYERIAAEAIQVFGGIGFTWEHPAHRHLKRARTLAQLLGPSHRHLEALADAVGLAT